MFSLPEKWQNFLIRIALPVIILLICLETKKILIWELTIVIDILQLCYSERLSGENA